MMLEAAREVKAQCTVHHKASFNGIEAVLLGQARV
jgi:hypothetical protein